MKIITDQDVDNKTIVVKNKKIEVAPNYLSKLEARVKALESYFKFYPDVGPSGAMMLDINRVYGFNVKKLTATDNLNDVLMPGIYSITSSAFATPENNYPVEKQVGEMYVSANSQLYIIKNNIDSRLWIRFYNAGTKEWSPWVKVV